MHQSRQIWRKSRITHSVYPGDSCLIRAWFDLWFMIRQFATISGFWMNHQRTRTWFALICLWCVYLYTLFMHFGGFLVHSGSFSTQVGWLTISWSVCGCSWMVHEFQIRANHAQCIAGIWWFMQKLLVVANWRIANHESNQVRIGRESPGYTLCMIRDLRQICLDLCIVYSRQKNENRHPRIHLIIQLNWHFEKLAEVSIFSLLVVSVATRAPFCLYVHLKFSLDPEPFFNSTSALYNVIWPLIFFT